MKSWRDLLIIIGLFSALILFVVLGPKSRPTTDDRYIPTTHSSTESGALALYTWMRSLGYDARRLEYRPFELGEGDAALVVLNPGTAFTQAQAKATLQWVERGGTLIFADDSSIFFGGSSLLLRELNVERKVYTDTATIERAPPAQPVLNQPPIKEPLVRTARVLIPQRNDYVKLVGPKDAIVVAGIKYGRGYVYLSAATYPFTNEGLRDNENVALVLNMLRRIPTGGRVQFDEYHHGFFEPPSTSAIVFGNPWGWAAAYAVTAIALYLILSGRRFGRPIPLKEEVARRSSAEYVESMADLFQRGDKRAYILKHYHDHFKRELARPYGINPQLADREFMRELSRFREVDEPTILALLERLSNDRISEADLVRTVADAEQEIYYAKSSRLYG